ncbi:hypothetical protein FHL15_002705 [Xylaria flabelliformis]|uniref:Uncharacterized protein n=1 Tax=Xylaria flabelliformis TaxID=2512241 RepID=A0A553I8A6_9PEZI|nr:hypothetical protein FHL15_002705 [Xylaria flabelliformis]
MACSWNPASDDCAASANWDSALQSSATGNMRVERPLFPEHLQPPPGFGKLSTIYDQPRGRTPQDGVHTFVVARSGVAAGTANHGIDRSNDIEIEWSRKEPLNHPEFKGYYNYEGRKFTELTALEKRQLEMAVHYPNIRKGIMKAPFYFRTGSFFLHEETQSKLSRQVFGTREIFDKIFAHLITRYEDLANLSAASQFTAHMVQSSWMHLDATSIDFLGWDENCLSDVRKMEEQEEKKRSNGKGKEKAKNVPTRTFSPTVMISPVRPEEQGPTLPVATNKAGYPLNPSVMPPEKTSFEVSMRAHYKLLHFSYLNGYAVKHLVLHGMPWVTVAALQRVISRMPRLEALGVHQCFLLTFGDTQPFLRAINAINKDRSNLTIRLPHIATDFSPFYYKGPPYKADGSGHMGEYGIVPEEKDWLDYHRAIPAQLFGIWDLCQKGCQDFFTPGTGFRAFLDRIPLRGVPTILKYIAAVHNFYNHKHHAGVCGSDRGATIYYPKGLDDPPFVSEELEQAMETTVWQDLIIACSNRSVLEELRNLIVLRGKVKLHRCRECEMRLPAYFFMAHILAWREQDVICHGCQLQGRLVQQVWLLYKYRRTLAQEIFENRKNKELSLCKVLKKIEKPARKEVKDEFGNEIKSARAAILCLPGTVDVRFLKGAHILWEMFTIGIPLIVEDIRQNIRVIDQTYDKLSFEDRLKQTAEHDKLERKASWCEALLGLSQRKPNDGSLKVTCLSWEQLIRRSRADMAIQNGRFVNHGPMHILNLRANAASMLGRSGGLPEYWDAEPDEQSGNSNTSGSRESSQKLLPHQRRPQKAVQVVQDNLQQTKPAQTADQGPHKLLPHQRRPIKTTQQVQDDPQHVQPAQTVAENSQKLLPHQWRPHMGPKPTENTPKPAQLEPDPKNPIKEANARFQNLHIEMAKFTEQYNAKQARIDQARADFNEWKEGTGAEAFEKIVQESIKLEEEAEAAVTAKTGIPPPPPWLINAAAASRSSPHQGWVRMLALWESACNSGRGVQ